jgi:hypothetical protein
VRSPPHGSARSSCAASSRPTAPPSTAGTGLRTT